MRILRSPKVTTDDRGRTVWVDPIETAKLELVSTQMLKQIIDEGDAGKNQELLDGTDKEYEAQRAASLVEESVAETVAEDEELELVSTQMLRTILSPHDHEAPDDDEFADTGFNPYSNV